MRVEAGTTTLDASHLFSVTIKGNNEVIKKAEVLFKLNILNMQKKKIMIVLSIKINYIYVFVT